VPACPPAPYGLQTAAPGAGKTVALTFDGGPGVSTDAILQILEANGVIATFFNMGDYLADRPATVWAQVAGGHQLGNHTWDHPHMTTLSAAAQADQMDRYNAEQTRLVGFPACVFRPPFGEYNSTTLSVAQSRTMSAWNWSVDTLDWQEEGSSSTESVNRIITRAQAGGSQSHPVILMHNGPVGNPATVAALPTIIKFYRDRGYTFVDLAGRVRAALPDLSPVGVAAAGTSAGTTLAFVRGTDRAVYVTTGTAAGFGGFRRIAADTVSAPAAVSWDGRRVDLFVLGTDRAIWHTSTMVDANGQPTTFVAWHSLGGVLTTAPAVASSAAGRLLVTARGTDGLLWSRTWNGTAWSSWGNIQGAALSAPAVDTADAETYRVLVVGTDGVVWQRRISAGGAPLGAWSSLGVRSHFAPAASATAGWARAVRAIAVSNGSGVRQIWGNGSVLDIGGRVTSAVALVERGTSTSTFARGTDNALWVNVATAGGSSWRRIGGTLA
jgi:peptidoglycan/xylan/chitin deacetylase (PgdA/CDA1 family)